MVLDDKYYKYDEKSIALSIVVMGLFLFITIISQILIVWVYHGILYFDFEVKAIVLSLFRIVMLNNLIMTEHMNNNRIKTPMKKEVKYLIPFVILSISFTSFGSGFIHDIAAAFWVSISLLSILSCWLLVRVIDKKEKKSNKKISGKNRKWLILDICLTSLYFIVPLFVYGQVVFWLLCIISLAIVVSFFSKLILASKRLR